MTGRVSRLLPPALLLAYALAFGGAALGTSLLVADDHPGQLFRLWHVVTLGPAPWAWNPGWWTGYPELQFYPPGFAYLGAIVHAASLGALGVDATYQALLWVTWLAPGATAYLALARLLGDGRLALPGAFVALTLSAFTGSAPLASGVEGGLHGGMAPARLAWSLLPLLLLALLRWLDDAAVTPWAAIAVVAAIVLVHPAHLPAAVVLVALAALVGAGHRRRRWGSALGVLAGAAALTAFWTLPLLARIRETRALAWGRLTLDDVGAGLTAEPLLAVLALLALAAFAAAGRAARAVALWPWAMTAVVTVDAAVLEPLGVRWLPADRVIDGAWLALVLAAGLGAGTLLRRAGERRRAPAAVVAVGALAGLSLLGSLPMPSLVLWPRPPWPAYDATARGLRLPDLWRALDAAPPGRALFVRSGIPLVYGTAWWRPHTHVTALTPLRSRPIVNGTFTHPSPVAALLYRGDAAPGAITRLVERLDGESLFGRPLEALDAAALDAFCDRLGVSVVVALEDDRPRLRALDDTARFASVAAPPPFVLYRRTAPVRLPRADGDGWRAEVEPGADGWAPVRMAYYPLWRARADGVSVPTARGEADQLVVRVPRATTVVLSYGPGAPEILGLVLSAAAALALAGAWWRARRRGRAGRATAPRACA